LGGFLCSVIFPAGNANAPFLHLGPARPHYVFHIVFKKARFSGGGGKKFLFYKKCVF